MVRSGTRENQSRSEADGAARRGTAADGAGARLAKGRAGAGLVAPDAALPRAHRAVLALGFVLIALLATRQVGSVDAGFHLRTGEHILAGNGWPRTDPFTFTVSDHAYIDTSWGYDVVVALAHRAFGAPGLSLFHAALVLAIFATLYRTARLQPVDPTTLVVLFVAGGLASEMRFDTRPELVSYLFLAIVIHVLARRAAGAAAGASRPRPLWILPAIFLVWANSHSLFVLGWGALAAFVAGRALGERRIDRELLKWVAASVAVTFVNPYGIRGVLFPFSLATRFQSGNLFNQSIGEFVSPFSLGLSEHFPFFAALPLVFAFRGLAILSIVALVVHARRRRWWAILLWLAFAPLAIRMFRNMPLLVVGTLATTIWALPLGALLDRIRLRASHRALAVACVLALVALGEAALSARVLTGAYYTASRRPERFGVGWNGNELPIAAAEFVKRAGIQGPVLNHLNFGGYLMWALDAPVFIDGRLEVMGERFYAEYQNVLASEEAMEAAVARYGIRWLVFPHITNPKLLARVSADARWRLVYVDGGAAVFVRNAPGAERFVDASARDALSGARVDPAWAGAARTLPGVAGNPRASRASRWLDGLIHRQEFPTENAYIGLFHYFRGELDAAGTRLVAAVRESRGAYYEIYNNLGSTLLRAGHLDEARACSQVVLDDSPKNRLSLERLAVIENARRGR
ncbi:MAG: tetratricopeptide repeat protein [bacterium]